jgi:hypothetical protein
MNGAYTGFGVATMAESFKRSSPSGVAKRLRNETRSSTAAETQKSRREMAWRRLMAQREQRYKAARSLWLMLERMDRQ